MPKYDSEGVYVLQAEVAITAYEKIAQTLCAPVAVMDENAVRTNLAFIAGIVACAEAVMDFIHEEKARNAHV